MNTFTRLLLCSAVLVGGMVLSKFYAWTPSAHTPANIALYNAVKSCDYNGVVNALSNGADPNMVDNEGLTPLHNAVARDSSGQYTAIIQYLLARGAQASLTNNDNRYGQTPEQMARSEEAVRALQPSSGMSATPGQQPQQSTGDDDWRDVPVSY